MGAFGEKLRKQREQRGLELDAISNTTKISPRMLRALEDEHFDQLPGGVFNKGFVRAYARQVGLDEEEAITEYLAALRESQIQQQSTLPDFRGPAGKPVPAGAPHFRKRNPPADNHSAETPPGDPLRGTDFRGNDFRHTDLRDTSLSRHDLPGEDLQGEVLHGKDLAGNEFRGDKPSGKDHRTLSPELRRADHRNTDHRNDEENIPSSPRSTPQRRPAHLNRYPAASLADSSSEPSAEVPWGMLAAALLLVTLLLAFWNLRRHPGSTAASNTATSSHPSAVATQASPPAQTSVSPAPLAVGKNSAVETLSAGTLSPGTISADATSSSVPTRTSSGPSLSETEAHPAVSNGASDSGKPAATASTLMHPPLAKTRTPAAAKPPATFTLFIRAEKTTWVSIVADGKPVAEETLIAPAHTSVHASHEIYVRVGNNAGLSFLLNGKEIPARGNEGEVKTYVFNAAGLQSAPQPAAANR